MGGPVGGFQEAELVQLAPGALLRLLGGRAVVERPEGDVLEHGRDEQLVVGVLEDEADPAADLPRGPFADGECVHDHVAGSGG